MRKILLLLLFLLAGYFSKAQDVIITNAGDTIKCLITKIDDNNIYFRFLRQGSVENTLIPLSEVIKYQHIYQGQGKFTSQYLPKKKYPRFMLGAGGGYSYRLAGLPSDPFPTEEYLQNLKTGFNIEAQGNYFFNKKYGIGLRYNFFRAKNYMNDIAIVFNNGHAADTLFGDLGDDIRINSFGPVFYFRFLNRNEKIVWLLGFSIGYAGYLDKAKLPDPIGNFTINGSTLGMVFIFGTDILVMKNMSLGVEMSIDIGTLSSITTNISGVHTKITLDDQERENLAKINLTANLRFWK